MPQLVPKENLPAAIAANSVGVNISRALGPALGGVTISAGRMRRTRHSPRAVAMVLYGLARVPATAILASVVAGTSWIGVVATLTVSAQVALPDWVRARGLALYTTVLFGCLTIGSAI